MNYTEYIILFLIEYFSHWQNALFWLLVLIFSLYESIKANHQKKYKMKIWMKNHQINKKIRKHSKITTNHNPNKVNLDKDQSYIDACWEEIRKH